MTEQAPNSTKKNIIMNTVDFGTLVLSGVFTGVASCVGPVSTGVAVAAVTLPFLFSFSGVVNRRFPLPDTASNADIEWANQNGLQRTGKALKNIFNDAKRGDFLRAVLAAGMLGGVGLLTTAIATDAHDRAQKQEELQKLPVLSGDTQIRVEEVCTLLKRDISFNTPFTHNGTQYKICP